MKKSCLLLVAIILIAGCTQSGLTPIVKNLPEVKEFLNEFPQATVTVAAYSPVAVKAVLKNFEEHCPNLGEEGKSYYKATVIDPETKQTLVAWLEAKDNSFVCAIRTSLSGEVVTATSTSTSLSTTTIPPTTTAQPTTTTTLATTTTTVAATTTTISTTTTTAANTTTTTAGVCSSASPSACLTQTECTGIGAANWCGTYCQSSPCPGGTTTTAQATTTTAAPTTTSSTTTTQPLPDLTATYVSATKYNNTAVTVSYVITNIGSGDAQIPFNNSAFLVYASETKARCYNQTNYLSAGQSVAYSCIVVYGSIQATTYNILIRADDFQYSNKLAETNENNNWNTYSQASYTHIIS